MVQFLTGDPCKQREPQNEVQKTVQKWFPILCPIDRTDTTRWGLREAVISIQYSVFSARRRPDFGK